MSVTGYELTFTREDGRPMEDLDRAFIQGVPERCAGSLDRVVDGEEVWQALRLDEAQTAAVVARLMRTGFVRDVATHFRIKITTRGIGAALRELPPTVPAPPLWSQGR